MDGFSSSSSDTDKPTASTSRRIVHEESASSDDDSINQQIDEELVESIRNALHLSIGNICREQDAASNDDSMGTDTPNFTMSNGAIAALTDLTYHYTTTLMANDLVSFSNHAGRKLIKPEDVLLMSRKDKNGIGADMKRRMKEIQSKSSKDGGRKKKSVSPTRKKSNSDKSNSPTRKKSSKKAAAGRNAKSTKNKKSHKESSSSSSSSGEEEAELHKMCQRVAERERQKSTQKNRSSEFLDDFIVNDNDFFIDQNSDDGIDFQTSAIKKKKQSAKSNSAKKKPAAKSRPKKNGLFNSSKASDVFKGLSDSDSSSEVVGKARYKTLDAHFSKKGAEGKSEDMVIDLSSGSDSD